jgi:HD superfamily phosphohydrolase
MSQHEDILRHLERDYTNPVRDPLWKHIYLTPALEKATRTAPFVRLGRLKQLGLAVLVYPGAVHTRANHSLGVFHLARRIIHSLTLSPAYPDHLTLEGVKAFLCAALFHDLGHFPYAHVLEDGLDVKNHEQLTAEAILASELTPLVKHEVGTDPAFVAAIVDHRMDFPPAKDQVRFFRRLLSGVLDPDKLDYLNRDAYFCGIPYGVQDPDFIISQMIPHRELGIGLSPKGIQSVESLLFSKYLMYKSVYWHKGVRAPSAVIKKALGLALREGVLKADEFYQDDDVTFAAKMTRYDHPTLKKIALAETPGTYVALHEQPYDEHGLFSLRIKDARVKLETEDEIRRELEKETGLTLAPEDVTIDVPHSVSFEVDLPILRDGRQTDFMDSGTVFDRSVVTGFTTNLKKMRLVTPRALKGKVRRPERFFL